MGHLQIVDGGDIVFQHMPSRLNDELNFILLLNYKLILIFEVFAVISIQVMVLWDMTPWNEVVGRGHCYRQEI
jgi:hypothetical protein